MQTLEIVVYMVIALLAGALFIGAIMGWDYYSAYRKINAAFLGEDSGKSDGNIKRISADEFAQIVIDIWKKCGFGERQESEIVYIKDKGLITKSNLFGNITRMNFCEVLHYNMSGCGQRDDVLMEDLKISSAIKITCDSKERKIYIS